MLQSEGGLCIIPTKEYLVIACYTQNQYPSVCVEATTNLGKSYRALNSGDQIISFLDWDSMVARWLERLACDLYISG